MSQLVWQRGEKSIRRALGLGAGEDVDSYALLLLTGTRETCPHLGSLWLKPYNCRQKSMWTPPRVLSTSVFSLSGVHILATSLALEKC